MPIDRAHQTEQLLWRYFGSSYNGMRGMKVWMGQIHENDKNIQKFINFIKSNQIERSFRGIVVKEQYFIFAS